MHINREIVTYRFAPEFLCLPHEPTEPKSHKTFINVDFENFSFLFSASMPKKIMLDESQYSSGYCTGLVSSDTNQLGQR